MMDWSATESQKIAAADDFHVSAIHDDGESYGTLTWIWSVVVDGAVYIRAYHGTRSRWYGAALAHGFGRVTVAGERRDVVFKPVSGPLNDRIDDAYRQKYAHSDYLGSMISDRARAATMQVTPRESGD